MDFVKKMTGGDGSNESTQNQAKPQEGQQQQGGGFMDKINSMAGGGQKSEQNEDMLDKTVDWVQENVMGQGQQSNESAVEQAKDEQISDFIRGKYKDTTGSDFPIADKDKKYGS